MKRGFILMSAASLCALASCQREAPAPVAVAPTYQATASVQEIMRAIVDPAADRVWDAVGSTVTQDKTEDRQPRTDAEWTDVRDGLLTVMEATNLLSMPGRKIVPAGGKLLDEGSDGVLSASESQEKHDAHPEVFVQFASALREVAAKGLQAVDKRDAAMLFAVGEEMDSVCEACHLTFWYPGQPVYRPTKVDAAAKK